MKKTMKLRLFFSNMLIAVASFAMADNYSVEIIPSLIKPGENFLMVVRLDNPSQTEISGWDFKMVLPEGITYDKAKGSSDFGNITSTPTVFSDAFSTNIVKDSKETNSYYVYSFSAGKINLAQKNTLVSFVLKSDEDISEKSIKGLLKACSLSDSQAKSYNLQDVEFSMSFGSTTTDINSLETISAESPLYNLNGQRVVKSTKGIYVKEGKKIISK